MQYIKITFFTISVQTREILIAKLADEGFEGFEETDEKLDAYIPATAFNNETVQLLASNFSVPFEQEVIGEQNWNTEWEKNFQPVTVDDFCTVRADFHDIAVETEHDIVITPKMTFGTGHHATTQLMIKQMRGINFTGKEVFDFGTGTGILAILAEKLGATSVMAIDNDEWSYENSSENIKRNHCDKISIRHGSIEQLKQNTYDIILANINRHILLMYMADMYEMVPKDGLILMSGLLKEDKAIIMEAATAAGLALQQYDELNNWITLLFRK